MNREITVDKIETKDVDCMLYCKENGKYYMDDEQERFKEDCELFEDIPYRLYLTDETEIQLDAREIVERACDNLHEDAYDNCDIKSLQVLLDKWCEGQTGATSHEPNYKFILVKEWIY